jgi:hypothetical protein
MRRSRTFCPRLPYPPRRGRGDTKPQGYTGPPCQIAPRRIKGRRNDKQSGKLIRGGSPGRSFNLFFCQNAVNHRPVRLGLLNRAPTIRANISGSQKILLVDNGLSISLIQSGVCYNRIRAASVTPIGVTEDELVIRGVQDLEF